MDNDDDVQLRSRVLPIICHFLSDNGWMYSCTGHIPSHYIWIFLSTCTHLPTSGQYTATKNYHQIFQIQISNFTRVGYRTSHGVPLLLQLATIIDYYIHH